MTIRVWPEKKGIWSSQLPIVGLRFLAMEIIPYIGDNRAFGPGELSVEVADRQDLVRLNEAVQRAALVKTVNDELSHTAATRMLSELRGLEEEIATSKKWIKGPIQQILNAIELYAKEIGTPIVSQRERLNTLVNRYVQQLEQDRAEAERKRQEEINREMQALAAQKAQALADAQAARDEAERAKHELAAAQAELAAEMAQEIANIKRPPEPPVRVAGGRIDHRNDFRLINVRELVASPGGWDLLRYELDKLACNDRVRLLVEQGKKVEIPGIEITPTTKVHMRPGARIK